MKAVPLSSALRELLSGPGPLLALTGAGVSAESGLATFRGPGGMWEGRDPMELATPEAFASDGIEGNLRTVRSESPQAIALRRRLCRGDRPAVELHYVSAR